MGEKRAWVVAMSLLASSELLWSVVAISTGGIHPHLFEKDELVYEVQVHQSEDDYKESLNPEKGEFFLTEEDADVTIMTAANGRQFACRIPNDRTTEQSLKSKSAFQQKQKMDRYREQLKELEGLPGCAEWTFPRSDSDPDSGWTYEVCALERVVKHRQDPPGKRSEAMQMGRYAATKDALLTRAEMGSIYGSSFQNDGDDDEQMQDSFYVQTYEGEKGQKPVKVTFECDLQYQGGAYSRSITHTGVHFLQDGHGDGAIHFHMRTHLICPSSGVGQLLAQQAADDLCTKKHQDWWTYELCVGKTVRQYHLAPGTNKPEPEFVVGAYDAKESNRIEATGESLRNVQLGGFSKPQLVFVQHYSKGTQCDVIPHAPREIQVQYFCGKHFAIHSVKEVSTCSYEMAVSNPSICEHRKFKTVQEDDSSPMESIHCTPL